MRNNQPQKMGVPILSTGVALVLATICVAIITLTGNATAQSTQIICHYKKASKDWQRQVVSPSEATGHLTNHPIDGRPGDPVPIQCGYIFNANCEAKVDDCPDYLGCQGACEQEFSTAVELCLSVDDPCTSGCVAAVNSCNFACFGTEDPIGCAMRCSEQVIACVSGCREACVGSATGAREECNESCGAAFPTCAGNAPVPATP
jgi:hypothetical protein